MTAFKGAKNQYTEECLAKFQDGTVVPFKATFKKLKRSESKALLKHQGVSMGRATAISKGDANEESLKFFEDDYMVEQTLKNLVGWEMPSPEEGVEWIPFTPENVAECVEINEYANALTAGFMKVQTGSVEADVKNS